ncbi:MAG: hypothetical protein M1818_000878 [Claussenomyces sp. TS43310]|nr:MAG: hypothetical protein M1818_000878 [Claussenomyces sp. TS43310]
MASRPARALVNPSQGQRPDLPPREWIWEELHKFGVIGIKNVQPSDLRGDIHPIFRKERWTDMTDPKRHKALEQSLQLATRLLEVGLPWLASLIPEVNFELGDRAYGDDELMGGIVEEPWEWLAVKRIQTPSPEKMESVRAEFTEITRCVSWKEEDKMWKALGWKGFTCRIYPSNPPFRPEHPDAIRTNDERCQKDYGFTRRHLTVGIAQQYIDALLESQSNTEQHLTAAFHAAITIVHELAHVVFWQNFRNISDGMVEPSIDDECKHELGCSFIAHIFGGWEPEPCHLESEEHEKDSYSFRTGSMWCKCYTGRIATPLTRRPKYMIQYSMPFQHIQRIMRQDSWDNLGPEPSPTLITKSLLAPQDLPFLNGKNARKAIPQRNFNAYMRFAFESSEDPDDAFGMEDDMEGLVQEGFARLGADIGPDNENEDELYANYVKNAWYKPRARNEESDSSEDREHSDSSEDHGDTIAVDEHQAIVITLEYVGEWDAEAGRLMEPPTKTTAVTEGTAQFRDAKAREIDKIAQGNTRKLRLLRDATDDELIRTACRRLGISTEGQKQELYERLVIHFEGVRKTWEAKAGVSNSSRDDSEINDFHQGLRKLEVHLHLTGVTLGKLRSAIRDKMHIAIQDQRLVLTDQNEQVLPMDSNATLDTFGQEGWDLVRVYKIKQATPVVVDLSDDADVLGKGRSFRKMRSEGTNLKRAPKAPTEQQGASDRAGGNKRRKAAVAAQALVKASATTTDLEPKKKPRPSKNVKAKPVKGPKEATL